MAEPEQIRIVAKWSGKEYPLELPGDATVGMVRERLHEVTGVQGKRQKIIGLGKKPVSDDTVSLSTLSLKPNQSFMMVGCAEKEVLPDASKLAPDELPDVINDLDWDFDPTEETAKSNKAENRRKLEEKLRAVEIVTINEPRPEKKLLVLDLDYTLLCTSGSDSNMANLKRPYCDEFLAAVWPHYDIVVWSQTSWRWLELKLTEMGILQNPSFSISFVLDRKSMFSVKSKMRDGKIREHEVKPLELIWRKFPERYSAANTVHVDDLSRNFALNPQQGLKITAYKEPLRARGSDRELRSLAFYLVHIALHVPDFTTLSHGKWGTYVQDNVPESR